MVRVIMTCIITVMLTLSSLSIHKSYKKETCEENFVKQLEQSIEFIRTADINKLNQEDKNNLLSSLEVTGLCGNTLSYNEVISIKDKNINTIKAIQSFLAQ